MLTFDEISASYIEKIKKRSRFRFILGLAIRLRIYFKYAIIRSIARFRGAKIGKNVIIPFSLALKANSNLEIGDDSSIEKCNLDLRSKIIIGNKVIINKDVQILRVSHFIDEDSDFSTKYYEPLIIEDFSWLCTGCHILPNVSYIKKGSVISAFATLVKSTEDMDVIGNFGQVLRKRGSVHNNLIVCSLRGGDLEYYYKARFK